GPPAPKYGSPAGAPGGTRVTGAPGRENTVARPARLFGPGGGPGRAAPADGARFPSWRGTREHPYLRRRPMRSILLTIGLGLAALGALALAPSEAHAHGWGRPVVGYYAPAYYTPAYYYAPPVAYSSYYVAPAYYPAYSSYYVAPTSYYPAYTS